MSKLTIKPGPYPCIEEIHGLPFRLSVVLSATDLTQADTFARMDAMRRLVACWNACAGEDRHFLEYIVSEGKTLRGIREDELARTSRFVRELNATEEQRDELLAALKAFADWYDERGGDNECRPLENARAVIAKIEGGAS